MIDLVFNLTYTILKTTCSIFQHFQTRDVTLLSDGYKFHLIQSISDKPIISQNQPRLRILIFNIDSAVFVTSGGTKTKTYYTFGRRGGLMVSALDSGTSPPGSSHGLGHCVVFLGKTLYSHGASLHPGV